MISSLSKLESKFDPLAVAVWAFRSAGFDVAEKMISNDGNQVFLFDGPNRRVAFLKRERKQLSAIHAAVEDIAKVYFRIMPADLKDACRTDGGIYALGGALVGGIAGSIVGSLLDGLRSPKLKNSVFFELTVVLSLKGPGAIEMKVVDECFGSGLTKDAFIARAEAVFRDIQFGMKTFSRWFEDKIASNSADASLAPPQENPSDLLDIRTDETLVVSRPRSDAAIAAIDQEVIAAWERLVGNRPSSLYAGKDIPTKKLDNAKAAYAPLTPEDTVVGLLDGTLIGSAKIGAVFTTRFFFWKVAGGAGGRLAYSDLDPATIKTKYKFSEQAIMLGETKVVLSTGSEKALNAVADFIVEAARIAKGQKG